jgi:hypothetical protein
MNLDRLMQLLRPQDPLQAATSPMTSPQLGMLNRMLGLAQGQAQTAIEQTPQKLAESQALLAEFDPKQPIDPKLLDQFMNLAGWGPMGMTKAVKWSLPKEYDDVTKLPIPKEFGGLKTDDYLFHGGIKGKLSSSGYEPYLTDTAKIDGKFPTSFSYSPQEALEYTTIAGGNMVAIPKKALNLYKGGNEKLNQAVMSNNMQALKDAGFDGVDLRSIVPNGYREVVVWNLDKAISKAKYAPVGTVEGEVAITKPLKSFLEE